MEKEIKYLSGRLDHWERQFKIIEGLFDKTNSNRMKQQYSDRAKEANENISILKKTLEFITEQVYKTTNPFVITDTCISASDPRDCGLTDRC